MHDLPSVESATTRNVSYAETKNFKRTVVLESESGELMHYGSDCASRTLRQDYRGKRYPVSNDAILSMARSAQRGESFARLSSVLAEKD
jgi:hypothetical protein